MLGRVFIGVLWRVLYWVDSKGPPPHIADMQAFVSRWDYAQADRESWDREPDRDRLSAALRVAEHDRAAALPELRALARLGSAHALNQLGECFYWGTAPRRTPPKASGGSGARSRPAACAASSTTGGRCSGAASRAPR